MKQHLKSPAVWLAFLALLVALSATPAGAQAAKLITGKNIKDNTVTTADVKNGSLSVKDFSSSTATALKGKNGTDGRDGIDGQDGQDGDTGPRGATGPQGQTGPQGPVGQTGPQGPAGPQGPSGIGPLYHDDGVGNTALTGNPQVISTLNLPAGKYFLQATWTFRATTDTSGAGTCSFYANGTELATQAGFEGANGYRAGVSISRGIQPSAASVYTLRCEKSSGTVAVAQVSMAAIAVTAVTSS